MQLTASLPSDHFSTTFAHQQLHGPLTGCGRIPIASAPPNSAPEAAAVATANEIGTGSSGHVGADAQLSADANAVAAPTSFDQLVEQIRVILGPSSGIDSADVDVNTLMQAMRDYTSLESDWRKYALADASRNYTRNGVDDINHKANLLVLVWNPAKGSMIHDHANAHCIMKILKGTLEETLYEWPEQGSEEAESGVQKPLRVKKVTKLTRESVAYMSDKLGLHRISNASPTEVAVSLHLYTPPHAAHFGCHIFNETTGKSHHVDMSNLFSDKGMKVASEHGTC